MIVNLVRNDLGRVARPGGVRVARLFDALPTPYVEHLVSEVVADLRDDAGPADLLRAVFPGGSVTGCPKVRAMEVIHELEPVGRGPGLRERAGARRRRVARGQRRDPHRLGGRAARRATGAAGPWCGTRTPRPSGPRPGPRPRPS